MTLSDATVWLHLGWTVTRPSWRDPSLYLRKTKVHNRDVFQLSKLGYEITNDDLNADDWEKLAQVD